MVQMIDAERLKTEHLGMQRWEDEGGATSGIEVPLISGRFVRPMLKTAGFQDGPNQWSTKFTIQPFQAGVAYGSLKRAAVEDTTMHIPSIRG